MRWMSILLVGAILAVVSGASFTVLAGATSAVLAGATSAALPGDEGVMVRFLDATAGPATALNESVEQDPAGFVWIGTQQGLLRYDGTETRMIAPGPGGFVRGCPRHGRIVAYRLQPDGESLLEVRSLSLVPLAAPVASDALMRAATFCSDDGALWVVADGVVYRQDDEGRWQALWATSPDDPARSGWPGSHGTALVATTERLFEVERDGSRRPVAALRGVIEATRDGDDYLALTWRRDGGHLHLVRAGVVGELHHGVGRPIALAVRGDRVWLGFDDGLVGVPRDPSPKRRSRRIALLASRLLVDREQMLWAITDRGIAQIAEPELEPASPGTSGGPRWITRSGDDLLFASWAGAFRLSAATDHLELEPAMEGIGAVCRDADGALWNATFDHFIRLGRARASDVTVPEAPGDLGPCALDGGGTLWMPTLAGLYRLPRGASRPQRVDALGKGTSTALFASDGTLWVGRFEGDVCRQRPGSDPPDRWQCEPLPQAWAVRDLIEAQDGRIWAAALGVYRRAAGGTWDTIRDDQDSTRLSGVMSLAESPRGGLWVVGAGGVTRISDRGDGAAAEVLETLGAWQGLLRSSAVDLLEEPNGTVWLMGPGRPLRVPASARVSPVSPRRVAITSLRADARELEIGPRFELPHESNRLVVRASAFSYREPGRVRYRYRLREGDPWSRSVRDPVFGFYNLAPGSYSLTVAASLDDANWTETGTPVSFEILGPWYTRSWFVLACLAAAIGIGYAFHRTRVLRLLALEQQRTRIAMDLHDAIGSGLGSIGLLAGIAGRDAGLPEQRRALANQVARMASDLGVSLSEIVWSLRPGSEQLAAVAGYLSDRGHLVFDPARTRFETAFPGEFPRLALPLRVQRNLLAIALEAMGNAASHADASRVELGFAARGRRSWSMWIEDDGRGLDAGVNPGTGLGLDNIRRRCAEIGARFECAPGTGGRGTRLVVDFDPGGGRWR